MSADNVLGWEIVLKFSHLPSKLRFSAKCSFFGQSLSRGHYQPTYQPPEGVYLLTLLPDCQISHNNLKANHKNEMPHGWNGISVHASASKPGLRPCMKKGKEKKGKISYTLSRIWIHDLIFSSPTCRIGYRKSSPVWFDDDFLYSRHRYAWQPIDVVRGKYLLNRLQNLKRV